MAANLPAREVSVKGGRERGEGACTPLHRGYWADFGKQYGVGKLSDGWKMNAHECAGTRANLASVEEKIKKNRRPESNSPYKTTLREVFGRISPVAMI